MNCHSNSIVETNNLSFKFNTDELVVNNLNLEVKKGSIYGFLGPNGAGKTTTIRLLLGLLPASTGSIKLFGEPVSNNRTKTYLQIGSLIEQPSLYEHLSGWDNLEITRLNRRVGKKEVLKVLDLVQLSGNSKRKVKAYSLGMKQRLGLALALLSEPELLILDEPVNGLDPAGIIDIRELLLKLNREKGTTIFLSSHMLSEIEKLVTHLGIIKKGRLIFQGTLEELKQINGNQNVILIETDNNLKASSILQSTYHTSIKENNILEVRYQNREQIAAIGKTLIEEGFNIYLLQTKFKDLEKNFMELTE